MNFIKKNMKRGFTLVELLIVIGILAVLAAVVIVAINPVQNLAKTRDAGRLSTVAQLGHALESYYTTAGTGKYVNPGDTTCAGSGATWIACLTGASGGSGDLNAVPANVTPSLTGVVVCDGSSGTVGTTSGAQNGWCYLSGGSGASPIIVYSRLESAASLAKCGAAPSSGSWLAYALYSSADGKSGVVCAASESALATGVQVFK